MKLQEMVRHIVRFKTSEHTRTLEAEVMRLRSENRALLNSILGIAGVPPITVAEATVTVRDAGDAAFEKSDVKPNASAAGMANGEPSAPPTAEAKDIAQARTSKAEPWKARRKVSKSNTGADAGKMLVASPTRRRSWQQINRTLEINSTKKKPQEPDS